MPRPVKWYEMRQTVVPFTVDVSSGKGCPESPGFHWEVRVMSPLADRDVLIMAVYVVPVCVNPRY